jgi:hypothetical protein
MRRATRRAYMIEGNPRDLMSRRGLTQFLVFAVPAARWNGNDLTVIHDGASQLAALDNEDQV